MVDRPVLRCLSAAVLATTAALVTPALLDPASATVGGTRDCKVNALGTAGSECENPTVGVMAWNLEPTGLRSRCTNRLIYNGDDKAVVLTAAHCLRGGTFDPGNGDGVNFDSQVEDDSGAEHLRDVIPAGRVIPPDAIIMHPYQQSSFTPGTDPAGNSELFSANDFALLVIDDTDKLERLNALWSLPHGQLVDLAPEGYFDALTPRAFRDLPLLDAGYGGDWIDYDNPSGWENIGGVGNAGFRSVVELTLTGRSETRLVTSQNQQKDLQGICYGDSGSSAFLQSPRGGNPVILAMPTWVHDGGTKCLSTVEWTRLDVPNARNFLRCAFTPGDALAVDLCVRRSFPAT
jgi:hypothetical protein